MLFRYEFVNKLDLQRFRKQAAYYLSNMREITYNVFLISYKLAVQIATPDDSDLHMVEIQLFEIVRDADNDITKELIINPHQDCRFEGIQLLTDLFEIDEFFATFNSDTNDTVEKLSDIIAILFKLNKLKAFY